MKKVLSSVFMVIIILSFLLTGCQGNKTVKNQEEVAADSNVVSEEKFKFRILMGTANPIPPDVDPDNNKWANFYKEAFPNVEFEWISIPSNNLGQKRSMMLAARDFPDMMTAGQKDIINWSQNGIIIQLDDIAQKYYPNIKKFLTDEDLKITKYEGKQWALTVPLNGMQNPKMMYARKDWLERLNLKAPETTEEAYEVMKAFTFKDPDGNGKNDTYGLGATNGLENMYQIFMAFDVDQGSWSRINGKLVPDNIRPEMKDALAYIKKLYDEGIFDKDSLVQDMKQLTDKAVRGVYGIVGMNTQGMNGRTNFDVKKASGSEFIPLTPFKGPKGKQGVPVKRNHGANYVVTIECKHPEMPAKLLNWLLEQDKTKNFIYLNADRINCGEPGIHSVQAGNYIFNKLAGNLEGEALKDMYRLSYRFMMGSANTLPNDHQVKLAEERVKSGEQTPGLIQDIKNTLQYIHYDEKIISGPIESELIGDLDAYFNDIKVKLVTGSEPLDSFDKWVEYFYKNGGQKIIDEVNRLNP